MSVKAAATIPWTAVPNLSDSISLAVFIALTNITRATENAIIVVAVPAWKPFDNADNF